jgi:hypothetical protein
LLIETWTVPGEGMTMLFNQRGFVTNEQNTFWFPTVPLFDYLLRFNRLEILDCAFLVIDAVDGGGYRIAVACRAIEKPDAGDDEWMLLAGQQSVDVQFARRSALTSERDDVVSYDVPEIGTVMTPGTGSINLASWVMSHSAEVVTVEDTILRGQRETPLANL